MKSLLIPFLGFFVCVAGQIDTDHCLLDNTAGCELGRAPRYIVMAPRRIRPEQTFQVFVTLLRNEFVGQPLIVHVSILRERKEYANAAMMFDMPASRILQLKMASNAQPGRYRLRVEGKLGVLDKQGKPVQRISGNVFFNETDIEFSTKSASLFIQMDRPIYRQEQIVHFRIIPINPDMMPRSGTMVVFIEDPTGFDVQRWQALQTNAGGLISQSFALSDQPNYGTWHIRVEAFGHVYRRPFLVEEFWEPRFDVNVTLPAYVMATDDMTVRGVVMANHTSGRACKGNGTITAFFVPSEKLWRYMKGWEKPYHDAVKAGLGSREKPAYKPVSEILATDYYLYFAYEYRYIEYVSVFMENGSIEYFHGRLDFEWTLQELKDIATRYDYSDYLAGHQFVFFANLTDWYFGLNRTGWAETEIFTNEVKLEWVGGSIRTFKPGAKMKVQVAASLFDGTPVADGGAVTLNHVLTQSNGDSSINNDPQSVRVKRGIAEFDLPIGMHTNNFILTATYKNADFGPKYRMYRDPRLELDVETTSLQMLGTKYYSPTNSYISISTSTWHPKVDEYMIFHVITTQFVERIFYQVISQGNIVIGDQLEMTSRQKTFAISLSRDMIPMARIMVYHIRAPEEIVSDVLTFFVNGTRHNEVKLEINRGKDFTRDTVEFNAYADPGSYVAFSGMIQDLYKKGLSDGITEYKLIEELMTYDEAANSSYHHLWRVSETDYEYTFYHGYDNGIDGNSSFLSAGLLVLTDAEVTQLPNKKHCIENANMLPCFSGSEAECYSLDMMCDGKYDCPNDGADEWGCNNETIEANTRAHGLARTSRVMRFYDNSSWAWQEIFVKPDGRVDFRVDVPKYPLTWMINGISLSRERGLGVMTRPVRFDTTRYMYIQVEHPEHIVMGEQIGVRVTVFNYWFEDDYMEILITMLAGDKSAYITVDDLGYTTSYSPKTHKGDQQTIVFLEPGQSQDIYLPIVPDKDLDTLNGIMDFRVTATCFMDKDEYVGRMKVTPNGVQNYFHTPYVIDLVRNPSVNIPSFEVNVDKEFRKNEIRENTYVPQSSEAMMSFFGDVVTPGFFEEYLNAENLLHRPYGSAEMVTFNFAYNSLALRYMWQSNQLTENAFLEEAVLKRLKPALQRILSYMNPDGSLKMFRDDKVPSLWLTAFVGHTLSKAVFGDWEKQLFIPQKLITKMVSYICSRQDPDTGAFLPEEGEIMYDRKFASLKEMKNGTLRIHEIPLTAYVLIALYGMTDLVKGSAGCLESTKSEATTFLSSKIYTLKEDEIFFLAISYYALSLTQQNPGSFNRMWEMGRNDSRNIYFADSPIIANISKQLNLQTYILPRQEFKNDAYAVQTTAYVLLSHIQSGRSKKMERDVLMKYINSMRNSVGGFASTQDTIVAMESLFEYTKSDTNRNEFELTLHLSASSDNSWSRNMTLEQNDFTRLIQAYLPRNHVYGFIDCAAEGTGRGLLQLTTTANVEFDKYVKKPQRYDNKLTKPVMKFFDINIKPIQFSGRNQSIMEMTSCVSWVYTEKSLTSGLAVLEINMPTGYVIMNDTLRNYVKSNVVPNLKRAEFYGRKLVYYFSHLDQSSTCVYFRADRWYPVANATREYRIRVYDYYEPGMHQTQIYTADNLHKLNICLVCGSYQCPYCPYFNSASILSLGFSVILLVIVFSFTQKLLLLGPR